MKVSLLRKFMPSIWRTCFNPSMSSKEVTRMFKEPIERTVFEKLREDNIVEYNDVLIPSCSQFELLAPNSDIELEPELRDTDKESAIVLIHWIGAFISTCYFPQSRRCALEMLLIIGRSSSLDLRL